MACGPTRACRASLAFVAAARVSSVGCWNSLSTRFGPAQPIVTSDWPLTHVWGIPRILLRFGPVCEDLASFRHASTSRSEFVFKLILSISTLSQLRMMLTKMLDDLSISPTSHLAQSSWLIKIWACLLIRSSLPPGLVLCHAVGRVCPLTLNRRMTRIASMSAAMEIMRPRLLVGALRLAARTTLLMNITFDEQRSHVPYHNSPRSLILSIDPNMQPTPGRSCDFAQQ